MSAAAPYLGVSATASAAAFVAAMDRLKAAFGALPVRLDGLDPDDGYRADEALCLVCNLTFYARLSTCPTCKDLR